MAAEGTVGLHVHAFYLHRNFAQDSAVVIIQNLLSLHGGFLEYAMHNHRETILSN